VTERFLEVAKVSEAPLRARQAFPFPVRALHADATSFHVHGRYEGGEEEVGVLRIVHGDSRDHRPDLKPWGMGLVCADTEGHPPPLRSPGREGQRRQDPGGPVVPLPGGPGPLGGGLS